MSILDRVLATEFTPRRQKTPKHQEIWVTKKTLSISVNDGTFGSNDVKFDEGEPVLISHISPGKKDVIFYKVGQHSFLIKPLDWFQKFFKRKR